MLLPPLTPATTIVPPERTTSTAWPITLVSVGTTSTAMSTPRPPVISITRATVSSSSATMVWAAPNSRASRSLKPSASAR